MHGGLQHIPLMSHPICQGDRETCHPSQHHRLHWNEAGIGDPSAIPKLFIWSRSLAGETSLVTPARMGCIFCPAKGRTQDPAAKMALLVQSLPPCTTRTRMGRGDMYRPFPKHRKEQSAPKCHGASRTQLVSPITPTGELREQHSGIEVGLEVPDNAQHSHCPHGTELRFREELDVVKVRSQI